MPVLRELDNDALVALSAEQYPEEHVIWFGRQVLAHGKSAFVVIGVACAIAAQRRIPTRRLAHVTPKGIVWRNRKHQQPVLRVSHAVRRDSRPAPMVRMAA